MPGVELTERECDALTHMTHGLTNTQIGAHLEGVSGVDLASDGTKLVARATICTTGITYGRLGFANEAGGMVRDGAAAAPQFSLQLQHQSRLTSLRARRSLDLDS
jgi:hypothetical protein